MILLEIEGASFPKGKKEEEETSHEKNHKFICEGTDGGAGYVGTSWDCLNLLAPSRRNFHLRSPSLPKQPGHLVVVVQTIRMRSGNECKSLFFVLQYHGLLAIPTAMIFQPPRGIHVLAIPNHSSSRGPTGLSISILSFSLLGVVAVSLPLFFFINRQLLILPSLESLDFGRPRAGLLAMLS